MTFDHEPTPSDQEVCSEVETLVLADLPPEIEFRLIADGAAPRDAPSLQSGEQWAYLRKEPATPQPWHPHPNKDAPLLDSPRSRLELASFIEDLADTPPSPDDNSTLPDFLHALAAWTRDMDGYFDNRDKPLPETPTWNLIATMLLAARRYE